MDFFEKIFENKTPQEMSNISINLNKFQLNRKEHIKKYNKLRILHSEVLDSMELYIEKDNYDYNAYYKGIEKSVNKETKCLDIRLDYYDDDDRTILFELFA